MSAFKYAVIVGTLGQLRDRYMGSGYKNEDVPFGEALQTLKDMNILSGIELSHASEGILSDATYVKQEIDRAGFTPAYVNSSLFGERRWAAGSLAASDPVIRNQALESVMKGMDFAKAVGAGGFNLWLGQDGFDYPFQTDYASQWKYLVDSLRIIADYDPGFRIAIEPKQREPRNRSIIDTVPTALLLCSEAGRDNLGLTIDIGHTLQSGQNIAQHVELSARLGRLFNLHVNDNYGSWDDDMIVGSVHLMEYLEMIYSLKKVGYAGWISVDIFPFREDSFKATRESVMHIRKYNELIDLIGFDQISRMISAGDVADTMKYIRETIFK